MKKRLQELQPTLTVCSSEEEVPLNLLSRTNQEPTVWSDHFQTIMYMRAHSRELVASAQQCDVTFIERPTEENPVFAQANVEMGNMTAVYYDSFYQHLLENMRVAPPLDLLVFLYVKPDIAAERRKRRDRVSEDLMPADYLRCLDNAYFNWIVKLCATKRILLIDWNTFGDTDALLERIADTLNKRTELPRVTLAPIESLAGSAELPACLPSALTPTLNMLFTRQPTEGEARKLVYFQTENTEQRSRAQHAILSKLVNAGKSEIYIGF